MKKIAILSTAIISFLSVTSCSDDDATVDTTKPSVNIITPTDDQEFELGSTINFKANLSDNVGLASYKVEVHSAEDGHHHKSNQVLAEEHFHFEVDKQVPNNAKDFTAEEAISVPEGVEEGHYHVGITVLDVNGNQNQQFVEIFIGHDHDH